MGSGFFCHSKIKSKNFVLIKSIQIVVRLTKVYFFYAFFAEMDSWCDGQWANILDASINVKHICKLEDKTIGCHMS